MTRLLAIMAAGLLCLNGCSMYSARGIPKAATLGIYACQPDVPGDDGLDYFMMASHWGISAGLFLLNPIAGIAYMGGTGILCGMGRSFAEAYASAL